jgi:hypothetical protein
VDIFYYFVCLVVTIEDLWLMHTFNIHTFTLHLYKNDIILYYKGKMPCFLAFH